MAREELLPGSSGYLNCLPLLGNGDKASPTTMKPRKTVPRSMRLGNGMMCPVTFKASMHVRNLCLPEEEP